MITDNHPPRRVVPRKGCQCNTGVKGILNTFIVFKDMLLVIHFISKDFLRTFINTVYSTVFKDILKNRFRMILLFLEDVGGPEEDRWGLV